MPDLSILQSIYLDNCNKLKNLPVFGQFSLLNCQIMDAIPVQHCVFKQKLYGVFNFVTLFMCHSDGILVFSILVTFISRVTSISVNKFQILHMSFGEIHKL